MSLDDELQAEVDRLAVDEDGAHDWDTRPLNLVVVLVVVLGALNILTVDDQELGVAIKDSLFGRIRHPRVACKSGFALPRGHITACA